MPRAANISNVERAFILEALLQGKRLDGRGLNDARKIELDFGDEYGSVTLRLGKTRFAIVRSKENYLANHATGY